MYSPRTLSKSAWFTIKKYWRQLRTPADAYQMFEISPDSINYVTVCDDRCKCIRDGRYTVGDVPNSGTFSTYKSGQIFGGEWDRKSITFDDYIPYISFRKHFVEDVSWEDTQFYTNVVENIREGNNPWGMTSEEEFKNKRCAYLDELFTTIRDDGYTSQKSRARCYNDPMIYDEVQINIGRDGNFFLNDGKHRLCFAKILDLDRIPVRVVVRHELFEDV